MDSTADAPRIPTGNPRGAAEGAPTSFTDAEINPSNMATHHVAKIQRGPSGPRGEVRRRILEAARAAFTASGYDGTTMRQIARSAGCDSALITYYFSTKQQLFRACLDLPSDPASDVIALLAPGPSGAAERLVDYALDLYEHHLTSDAMSALMRALATDAETSQRFRAYISTEVLGPVAAAIGAGTAIAQRIEIVLSMMHGVVTMRYIVRLEPLASMPREQVRAQLAPLIQPLIDSAFKAPTF